MDKVGFGIKLEQIGRLCDKGLYEEAAKVADTIEWRKVKKWSELSIAEEVYEKAGRHKDARNICVYAYNRNLGGKRLLYKLTELSIIINDLDEAEELYNELVEEAPNDTGRFILKYKLNVAKGAPLPALINILEEYKSNELEEEYEYELALLYAKAGRVEEAVRECDDLVLWFNEGEYVEKALELKSHFAPLSKSQQAKYEYYIEARKAGINPHIEEEPEERYESVSEAVLTQELTVGKDTPKHEEEVLVPEKDYNIYDTQNIQEELAKSMSIIMESLAKKEQDETAEQFKASDYSDETVVIESLDAVAATEEVKEDYSRVVSDIDEVSEPTKEIRINTHHWNNMSDIEAAREAKASIAAMTAEAITTTEANKAASVALAAEEVAVSVQEAIEGQIGLLDWLNSVPEVVEEAAVTSEPIAEPAPEAVKVEPVIEPAPKAAKAETVTEPETTDEPVGMDTTELAIDMLTKELMKEVQEEMAAKEAAESEVPHAPEEEYIGDEEELETESEPKPPYEPEVETIGDTAEIPLAEIAQETAQSAPVVEEENYPQTEMQMADSQEIKQTEEPEEDVQEVQQTEAEPQIEEVAEETPSLTVDERKYVRKYLGMDGMEEAITTLIQCKREEVCDGTSAYGNIVITGRVDADKTGFAINLFKAIHANDDIRQLKIAKTTAGILNKKGVLVSADKIKGTTMIIENAGALMPETVKELTEFMNQNTDSMLVIITGEDYSVKKLFMDAPDFAALFTHSIELKKMSVNDLVVIAKEYAKENGYSIDEKALLKVYLLIDELQNSNQGDEVEGVKGIIDGAIAKCNKKGKSLFGRKSSGLVSLKEKYF